MLFRSTTLSLLVGFAASQDAGSGTATAAGYPVTYTSCGVNHTLYQPPQRIVTMNQGVTEFMLAMGLADRMAGTAYLDDNIWPRYATAYAGVPVLSSGYPTETQIITDANALPSSVPSASPRCSCSVRGCSPRTL